MSERDLWCAVLVNAIDEARGGGTVNSEKSSGREADRQRAYEWLTKPNRDFTLVCHLAGFDPEAVRERAVKLLAEPYVPRRQPQRSDTPKRTRRRSVKAKCITFNGVERTINEWSEVIGMSPQTIRSRLYKGWTIERTLTEPSMDSSQRKARGWSRTSNNSEGTGAGSARESEPNWSNFQDTVE